MKIVNNTDLSYREIGSIIDLIIKENQEDTHYIGQIEVEKVEYKKRIIKIQIRYLKRYIEWRFDYE